MTDCHHRFLLRSSWATATSFRWSSEHRFLLQNIVWTRSRCCTFDDSHQASVRKNNRFCVESSFATWCAVSYIIRRPLQRPSTSLVTLKQCPRLRCYFYAVPFDSGRWSSTSLCRQHFVDTIVLTLVTGRSSSSVANFCVHFRLANHSRIRSSAGAVHSFGNWLHRLFRDWWRRLDSRTFPVTLFSYFFC